MEHQNPLPLLEQANVDENIDKSTSLDSDNNEFRLYTSLQQLEILETEAATARPSPSTEALQIYPREQEHCDPVEQMDSTSEAPPSVPPRWEETANIIRSDPNAAELETRPLDIEAIRSIRARARESYPITNEPAGNDATQQAPPPGGNVRLVGQRLTEVMEEIRREMDWPELHWEADNRARALKAKIVPWIEESRDSGCCGFVPGNEFIPFLETRRVWVGGYEYGRRAWEGDFGLAPRSV